MAFEAVTSAVLNALGSGNLTQALINNAINPQGTLGSDDPHDMYNIQTQYAPPGTIPTTAVGAYPGPIYPAGIEVPTPETSTWDAVRGWLSNLIPAAEAKNTSIFKSPRIEVEPTPKEELAISEALMQLDAPRIPYSLPEGARGAGPDTRQYLLNRQFGTGTETRAPMVDTFAPPEPPYITPVSQALQGIFPEGAPTSLLEEAQPPRSLPIGTPGWQPNIPAQTLIDPALEQALTYQYNPAEFGLDPFTREQVGTSSNFLANLMAEGTEAQKTAIQRAISPATAGILREDLAAHFAPDDAESPFTADPSTGETYEFASRAPIDMANIMRATKPKPTPKEPPFGPVESPEVWRARQESEARSAVEEARAATRAGGVIGPVTEALKGSMPDGRTESGMVEPLDPSITRAWDTDRATWGFKRSVEGVVAGTVQGNIPGTPLAVPPGSGITREDDAKFDVRAHINLAYGLEPETAPANWSEARVNFSGLMPRTPNPLRDFYADITDSTAIVENMADEYKDWQERPEQLVEPTGIYNKDKNTDIVSGALIRGLKDVVNNEVIREGREFGLSPEQVYNSPNLVFDEQQLSALAEQLASGSKKDFTDKDVMKLSTQVESFSAIKKFEETKKKEEKKKEEKKAAKKERDKKREAREAKKVARKEKEKKAVKQAEVKSKAKVTKSAAAQALSRARGNTKDAVRIAQITKSFTALKKKDPTVYMPTIRRGPSGAWIGGF
jgi:hypothetical protein